MNKIINSPLSPKIFRKKEQKILLIGFQSAGKTTLLYKLKLGERIATIPTIGFNKENVQYNNSKFEMWDLGGIEKVILLLKILRLDSISVATLYILYFIIS